MALYFGEGGDQRFGADREVDDVADVTEALRAAVLTTVESEWNPLRTVDGKAPTERSKVFLGLLRASLDRHSRKR